jgi:hypothetical protein
MLPQFRAELETIAAAPGSTAIPPVPPVPDAPAAVPADHR